jgi:hypothetical protein
MSTAHYLMSSVLLVCFGRAQVKLVRRFSMAGLVAATAVFATCVGASAAGSTLVPGGTVLSGFAVPGIGQGGLVTPGLSPAVSLVREQESAFGSFPSSGDPQAVTVDQSTGDIYVVSPSGGTMSRFTPAGNPDNFTAGADSGTNTLTGFSFDTGPSATEVAVAPAGAAGGTAGDIYVASFAGIDIFAQDGTHLGQITQANGENFEETCGVATDNTGELFVSDYRGKINRYTPTANPATNTDYNAQISGVFEACNIAADSTGAVYVSSFSPTNLRKYPASDFGTSNPPTTLPARSRAVAVDPSTDDVYIDEGNSIAVFNSAEEPLYTFGSEFGSESAGVAVMGADGDAYVADPVNHRVDVFGPAFVPPPSAVTGEATEIHHATAKLNGHLDPNGNGEVTDCHFELGATTSYGINVPCAQGNNFATAADVSAVASGLEPSHTYHFRLSVSRGASTGVGADQTFETVSVPMVHAPASPASFGSSGSGDGQLSGNTGIGIDQSTGDVYVADTSNHRIEKFDREGAFLSAWGWGVSDGKASAETCTSACQAGIPGAGLGQLATPEFIAVDNSGGPSKGDVYVGDTTNKTVTKFDATGEYLETIDGSTSPDGPFGELAGIAIDPSGNLFVLGMSTRIFEFDADGGYVKDFLFGCCVTPHGLAIDSHGNIYRFRGSGQVQKSNSSFVDANQDVGGEGISGTGIAIDPTNDDVYIDLGTSISRYSSSETFIESFGTDQLTAGSGVGIEGASGTVLVSDPDTVKIFSLSAEPEVSTDSAVGLSGTSALLHGTVTSNAVALTDCRFEFVTDVAYSASGFSDLSSGGSVPCEPAAGAVPLDFLEHPVSATITGLNPANVYYFRISAGNDVATVHGAQAVVPGLPLVETTGSPTRTAATARLDSRVNPHGASATYHFEYGDEGPCGEHHCTATTSQEAGSAESTEFVSQQLSGLQPGVTYHYRVVAESAVPGGPVFGQDATVVTRTSDAPLTHGTVPGPRGSDRAWEQVNVPDTGGNPVNGALAISENGERAVYAIDGGSPGSQNGGGLINPSNLQYAERTPTGWQRNDLFPTRAQAPGNLWNTVLATNDLSHVYGTNVDITNTGPFQVWSLSPAAVTQLILEVPFASGNSFLAIAADANRTLADVQGSLDPGHPVNPEDEELYELTTGTPHLVGLLPDGTVPPCGVRSGYAQQTTPADAQRWVSPDGSHAVFATYPAANTGCAGETGLYVRDLVDSTTTQIAENGTFDRIAGGNVFFTTPDSIAANDHGGTDLYRYGLADQSVTCVTCSTPLAGHVEISNGAAFDSIAISDDGSHAYMQASERLLAGAAVRGIYALDVSTGDVAYVAPNGGESRGTGNNPQSSAVSPDGTVFAFSSADPALDALNGQQNAGSMQIYRYDDRDGSLVCVSCPGDGTAPVGEATLEGSRNTGSTANALTTSGNLEFVTDTPLSPYDENTAHQGQEPGVGADVYEWREGQLLLVTDGEISTEPRFEGASADGLDVFFSQPAQLTPEAPDAQRRIYDARIGGGFTHPKPPPPCSLEDCQGIPQPPPDDPPPASATFNGSGNLAATAGASTTDKPTSKSAPRSRAEKLAKALKVCRKDKKKSKRAGCERVARKQYGAVKRAAKRTKNKRRGN